MAPREVVTLCFGHGGCQLGKAVWDQYSEEHAILPDGSRSRGKKVQNEDDTKFLQFFEETRGGKFFARNISIDLDPITIEQIQNTRKAALYRPRHLISGDESSDNNFAAGYSSHGGMLKSQILEAIREVMEKANKPQGFIIQHSVGGGTGSGLAALISEYLSANYQKISKIGFEIYPSADILDSSPEIYNAVFSTRYNLDEMRVSFIFDNEALYNLCWDKLDLREPRYANFNRLIAKVSSGLTLFMRFNNEDFNVPKEWPEFDEYVTKLIPFPRLHFITTSLAPIASKNRFPTSNKEAQNLLEDLGWDEYVALYVAEFLPKKRDIRNLSARVVAEELVNSSSFCIHYPDFNSKLDLYMATTIQFRGRYSSREKQQAMKALRKNGLVNFVDWMPKGYEMNHFKNDLSAVKDDDFPLLEKSATMCGNNVCIKRWFKNRFTEKFTRLFDKRENVQRYIDAGLEEAKFIFAQEVMQDLEKDYSNVTGEEYSDSERFV